MTATTRARLLELAARLAEVQREVARLVALARELTDHAGPPAEGVGTTETVPDSSAVAPGRR
jgi:hypothetical protein